MKLKDYLDDMNALIKEHPEALEFDIVYAADDEGNDFQNVRNVACVGLYQSREFTPATDFELNDMTGSVPNAVCLN